MESHDKENEEPNETKLSSEENSEMELDNTFEDNNTPESTETEKREEPNPANKQVETRKRKTFLDSTPQLRKSERPKKIKTWDDYVTYYTTQNQADEPESMEEALEGHNREHWIKAMEEEYQALKKNNTWEYATKAGSQNLLTTK